MPTPTSWSPVALSALSGITRVDSLISGTQWASNTISFSFPDSSASWSTSSGTGYGPANGDAEPWLAGYGGLVGSQRSAVRKALAAWSDVADLDLTEVADDAAVVGDLRFAFAAESIIPGAQAWAYYPANAASAGDVWFSTGGTSFSQPWDAGSYEYLTLLHEIGHTLGLKHSFAPESQNATVLNAQFDTRSYTVMSYSARPNVPGSGFSVEPTTPMLLDIAAIQSLYGANSAHHSEDTRYRFKGAEQYHQTIWDAAGVDTIEYRSTSGGEIDLRGGYEGSRLGRPVYVLDNNGEPVLEVDNIWIAFGVVIENASGGSGADLITGNNAANFLRGGRGADTLSGGASADTLQGGQDADLLSGGRGNDWYLVSDGDVLIEYAGEGEDTVQSPLSWTLGAHMENLVLSRSAAVDGTGNSLANTLTGNSAANTLSGRQADDTLFGRAGQDVLDGALGNDTLKGGGGADTLDGGLGSDLLFGRGGADVFVFRTAPGSDIDTIGDFVPGSDVVQLDDDFFSAFDAGSSSQLSAAQFHSGAGVTAAHDADDRIVYDTATGALYYDADGIEGVAAVQFAQLGAVEHPVIGAADFLIVT